MFLILYGLVLVPSPFSSVSGTAPNNNLTEFCTFSTISSCTSCSSGDNSCVLFPFLLELSAFFPAFWLALSTGSPLFVGVESVGLASVGTFSVSVGVTPCSGVTLESVGSGFKLP